MAMVHCRGCGKEIHESAVSCPHCGATQGKAPTNAGNVSEKEWLTTLLLAIFLGGFGIHRFYVGKTGTGIAQLLTLGGCGIWVLIDLITIVTGGFKDAQGLPLKK
jgi:hypothetical protein